MSTDLTPTPTADLTAALSGTRILPVLTVPDVATAAVRTVIVMTSL